MSISIFKTAKSLVNEKAYYGLPAGDPSFASAASGINEDQRKSMIQTKAITSPRDFTVEKAALYSKARHMIEDLVPIIVDELKDVLPQADAAHRVAAANKTETDAFGFGITDEPTLKKFAGTVAVMLESVFSKAIEYNYPSDLSKAAVGAAQLKNITGKD